MSEALRTADAHSRERALDPHGSFIVQAPAGSGKTELLTQRCLVLLATVEHPEEVLALTFTNKAAAEMRDRIVRALARARDPEEPAKPHQRLTWTLARAVLARDAALGWQLEENPGRLRVRTIDALCAALARQLPLAAGFGAAPRVLEDAQALYVEAARATLGLLESGQQWSPAVARLLRHLDNDFLRVEQLLAAMLARRDQWLRQVGDGERINRTALEDALTRVVREALAAAAAAVPDALRGEIVGNARHAGRNLQEEGAASAIVACARLVALPGDAVQDRAAWYGIATLLLSKEGQWRRRVDKSIGFPPPAGSATEKERRKEAKSGFEALLARLAGDEALRERLVALATLPAPAYADDQWGVLEALAVLLPLAAAQLKLVFRARREVDFVEVAHGALHALGPALTPSDLALALDYRIRHILVDEFQDTSYSQYELLARLTAGWEPGDGRTFFAVGDPMQSIYRFREAEVGLYLRARHEGIGAVALEPLRLTVNFRSQENVVEWVNEAFAQVLPREEDLTYGAVPYAPAMAHHPRDGQAAVTVHTFFEDASAVEAQRVVALVGAARAADPDGSVAILVRSRGHLDAIVPALRSAGVRFLALDIEPLGYRQVVQDLLALTRALEHPADRIAWLALLRAPWCGLELADLHILCGGGPHTTVWDQLGDAARLGQLPAAARARVGRVVSVVRECLAHRRRRSLRRTVEGAWLALGGPACVLEQADLDDAEVFFDLIEEMESAGEIEDLALLEQRVEKLFALPDPLAPQTGVQLMTIHKSKGLEFDTVIVPGLGRAPRSDARQLLMWAERPLAHGGVDLLLAPIAGSSLEDDTIYQYLRRLEGERSRFESGRLLYVAATRARKQLHLLGHVRVRVDEEGTRPNKPAAGSLLATLWPAVAEVFEREARAMQAPEPPRDSEARPAPTTPSFFRLPVGWTGPAPPPAVLAQPADAAGVAAVEFDWAGETARHVGTVAHRWLLHIARDGAAHWDAARLAALEPQLVRALAALGVAQEALAPAAARVRKALANTLADPRGRWLLDAGHLEAQGEYGVSGFHAGRIVNVVLDRTFVDAEGVRWIVDYKTGLHEGAGLDAFLDRERERYAPQLERYAALMRGLDARPIRLGLYFPLMQQWREWTGDGSDNGA